MKIGVYICHCGLNIGGVINIDKLIEFVKSLPFVAVARQYCQSDCQIGAGFRDAYPADSIDKYILIIEWNTTMALQNSK